MTRAGHTQLLLDFSNVWASSSFGILTNLQRMVDAAGGRLKVYALSSKPIQLFRMTKLDLVFEIHECRQSALRDSCSGGGGVPGDEGTAGRERR